MTFGIIKERKNPPDRRVVFAPADLEKLKTTFPDLEIFVEQSDIRVFNDLEYKNLGINVVTDMSNCDVLFGVKEVPIENLIPNKKYFFFSHTIKKQAHNLKLLQAVLERNIELYDHETLVTADDNRLIGFGFYAGIVGAYNAFRAFGQKFELFALPKAESLQDKEALYAKLRRQTLPPIKIVLTGFGKVAHGAKETLTAMKVKEVSTEDFISKNYSQAVYTQIDVQDYYKRIDGGVAEKTDFYKNAQEYVSNFERFANNADIFIAGHFYATGAPEIVSRKMLSNPACKIKVVADISCDIDGPIACTVRTSTIAEPFYGYLPVDNSEVAVTHPGAIVVMAVDNLPCELPRDASIGFGQTFIEKIIPAFFDNDKDGILSRAKITENGKLTQRFAYLQDFVDGK